MSVMMRTSFLVGFITFLCGFVGPIILTPEANLGPLLGLFITGPLGFLLGGVIGFWRILWDSTRKTGALEWGMFLVIWLLMMGWYLIFFMFGPTAILLGTLCQLAAAVGTALIYRQRCGKLNQPIDRRFFSVLFAALFIISTEFFPPVTHPDWARPQDGYLQNPPAAVFYWDSRLDSSYKVPQLAINRTRLMELWVLILSLNAVAWLVFKPNNPRDTDKN